MSYLHICRLAHECGELPPPGDATGGHGVPGVGVTPELLGDVPPLPFWPFSLPAVDGFGEAEFGVDSEFGVGAPLVASGKVPHGDPFGELPGFGVLGLVEGCVVFGVPVGDVDPGTVRFCGDPVDGVAVPAGGVAVLAGGVAVLAGGVAGEPGVEVCPAP